ncbi:hypothetical protein BLOT_006819 [Blomia tropicalis]|nr:hypothetical protein BLOT_006819 [Blomia tropicalis]
MSGFVLNPPLFFRQFPMWRHFQLVVSMCRNCVEGWAHLLPMRHICPSPTHSHCCTRSNSCNSRELKAEIAGVRLLGFVHRAIYNKRTNKSEPASSKLYASSSFL